jgi:microcystin-dependent protein
LAGLTNTTTARTNLDVYSKAEAAQKNGDAAQSFSVANGTTGNEAVNFQQLDTKAEKNGSASEAFSVATATSAAHAVRNDQLLTYLPSGVVVPFAGTSIPTGWLECNGAAVSRTTYSLLFAAIGTLYGIGDGSTTFNLPDLRGEFVRGYDNGRNVDTGRVLGSAQADEYKAHTHTVGYEDSIENTGADNVGGTGNTVVTPSTYTKITSLEGGTETRPRNIAMYHIIRT